MFWEVIEQKSVSILQNILEETNYDHVTLEQLIDNFPDLTNEYDVGNKDIIYILKRRNNLESLIRHVTEMPSENLDEDERFKYANICCVLFSSKNNQIESELINHIDLLDKMLNFLKTDQELNPLMASFFTNSLFSIYCKFNSQMVFYLSSKKDFFNLLFKHINVSAIMDILLKITTLDSVSPKRSQNVCEWLNSQEIIKKMINVFRTKSDLNSLENTAYLLTFLVHKNRQSLIVGEEKKFFYFYNESFLNELIHIAFNYPSSTIHIVRFFNDFIDPEIHFKLIDGIKGKFNNTFLDVLNFDPLKTLITINSANSILSFEYLSSIKDLHNAILPNLGKFKNLLLNSVPDYSIRTSTGFIEKPIGRLRLEVINLFYAILQANNPEINHAIAELRILEILIDLFFEYKFNSFLHNHVNNIITAIFLNSNKNRFKLLANAKEKKEFLSLDSVDKLKEKGTFFQVINYLWSDNECYEHVRKIIMDANKDINLNKDYFREANLILAGQKTYDLEYTPLISQLFKECNLVERIMKHFRSIVNEKDIKKPIPTHKSNLVDIADTMNKYLSDYEKKNNELPSQLTESMDLLILKDWFSFSEIELESLRKKVSEIEKKFSEQEAAADDIQKFFSQPKIRPFFYESLYYASDYEFSNQLFEPQFDRDLKERVNPEMPNLSTVIDQSIDVYLSKFKSGIPQFSKDFDEEKSIEEQKEPELSEGLNEQFNEYNEQISANITEKDNIFQPLASSSNISNDLNIEMDSDILKEEDGHHFGDSFCGSSTLTTSDVKSSDNKGIDQKPIDVKSSDNKESDQKPIDVESSDNKGIDQKPIDVESSDNKESDEKPIDVKSCDSQGSDEKPIDVKSCDSQGSDEKPIDVKSCDSQGKDEKNINNKSNGNKENGKKPIDVNSSNIQESVQKSSDQLLTEEQKVSIEEEWANFERERLA